MQTYNFGSNYLDWLDKTNQQDSLDTAFEYSSMFYEKLKSQGIHRC
ncbi:lysozyme family protein [Bacillus smithii]